MMSDEDFTIISSRNKAWAAFVTEKITRKLWSVSESTGPVRAI